MVRRGSTVRVRQRALRSSCQSAVSACPLASCLSFNVHRASTARREALSRGLETGSPCGLAALRAGVHPASTAVDIHYELGEGHPLLGRRMPDLDLATPDGPLRIFPLLHDAQPVLLNLGAPGGFDITPWADRVGWSLPNMPVGGSSPCWRPSGSECSVDRPDGHVARVGDQAGVGLAHALTTWFGPPAAAWRRFPWKDQARARSRAARSTGSPCVGSTNSTGLSSSGRSAIATCSTVTPSGSHLTGISSPLPRSTSVSPAITARIRSLQSTRSS